MKKGFNYIRLAPKIDKFWK